MNAIERLKRDHTILRSKLGVLEAALTMGPETWFVLREVCHTLAHQLRDHIQREEVLVAACRAALNQEVLARIEVEHRDEPQHLRAVSQLFVRGAGRSLDQVRPELTRIIEGLRRHMDEEERELFPILERVLSSREAALATSVPRSTPSGIDEVMTVNRVIQEHPQTKSVFEQLFVNIPYEGCDCLDEVAWRHGMDSRELLDTLERVLGTTLQQHEPLTSRKGAACSCR